MRVLYVDDSALARAAASKVITERGIDVTVVGSVAEAREIDPGTLGAALLDLEVGTERGTDIATHLRTDAPLLPIAFLTGAESGELLAEARAFGPVFDKALGLEQVLVWLAAFVG